MQDAIASADSALTAAANHCLPACVQPAWRSLACAAGAIVKRRYRIRRNARFQEIRSRARAFSNDLLVLAALPNELPYSRFGFSVSSRIGGAVQRNRIKRQLREIMRLRMEQIAPGWDVVIIVRRPARDADYWKLDAACARLLGRAHLLNGEGKL